MLTKNFVACVHFVRCNFLHCHSFSPCWSQVFLIFSPLLWNFHVFFQRNWSPSFFISRSSSFSVIHVSVDIKNNLEKDSTLLLCFLSKSPGGHAISRFYITKQEGLYQNKVNFSLVSTCNYILRWYAWGAGEGTVGRTVTWLPKFLGWMDYQIFLGMGLRSRALCARAELRR